MGENLANACHGLLLAQRTDMSIPEALLTSRHMNFIIPNTDVSMGGNLANVCHVFLLVRRAEMSIPWGIFTSRHMNLTIPRGILRFVWGGPCRMCGTVFYESDALT